MKLVLTVDDAPAISREGVPKNPGCMDTMRETLAHWGIKDCVAFVIGELAEGHEDKLRRWLDQGYVLGNHTSDHHASSMRDVDSTLRSVETCDRLLESVGAFKHHRRWFRFPYLDRGGTPEQRYALHTGLREMGYRVGHASTDLFDQEYELPLQRALSGKPDPELVKKRYCGTALRSVRTRARRMPKDGQLPHQVLFFHFGPVSESCIGGILKELLRRGASFHALEEAMDHPAYRQFDEDMGQTGCTTRFARRGFSEKAVRRLVRLSERLNSSPGGPRWPHLR